MMDSEALTNSDRRHTRNTVSTLSSVASRTRSHQHAEAQNRYVTVTLRSSVRGLDSLVITIPGLNNWSSDDNTSDATYLETMSSDNTEDTATVNDSDVSEDQDRQVNLEKLNKFTITKKNCPVDDCSICLEGFTCRQHCRELPCSHIFHKKCVDRWLRKSPQCPVCRTCIKQHFAKPMLRNVRVLRPRTY
jgi:hypothetical protein